MKAGTKKGAAAVRPTRDAGGLICNVISEGRSGLLQVRYTTLCICLQYFGFKRLVFEPFISIFGQIIFFFVIIITFYILIFTFFSLLAK